MYYGYIQDNMDIENMRKLDFQTLKTVTTLSFYLKADFICSVTTLSFLRTSVVPIRYIFVVNRLMWWSFILIDRSTVNLNIAFTTIYELGRITWMYVLLNIPWMLLNILLLRYYEVLFTKLIWTTEAQWALSFIGIHSIAQFTKCMNFETIIKYKIWLFYLQFSLSDCALR